MSHFIEANGWYFVHPNPADSGYPAVFSRVVIWRKDDDDQVVGLISATGRRMPDDTVVNTLVPPPPAEGTYLHWNEMSEADRQAARQQSRPGYLANVSEQALQALVDDAQKLDMGY